jgi:hypothetical protein
MKKGKICFLVVLLVGLIPWAGCSSTKSFYRGVMPGKTYTDLKKRVLFLPIMDQAALGEAKVAALTSQLITLLDEKGNFLIVSPTNPVPASAKIRSPGYGVVMDPDQAKWAEEKGMNVLMTTVISPLEVQRKKKGIWPFRKFRRELEISMVVNALDVTNDTLLLTHLESRKIKLPALDELEESDFEFDPEYYEKRMQTRHTQRFKPSEINKEEFDEAWVEIIKDQASTITDALNEYPWSGRILSVDSETVVINAGQDVGLTEGYAFEVFSKGEPIVSGTGRTFHLLGQKAGEIKVTKIMNQHAFAVATEGGSFIPGQIIRSKD